MPKLASISIFVLKCVVNIYDVITLPIYFIMQKPWKKWKRQNVVWAKHIKENDPHSAVIRIIEGSSGSLELIETVDDVFRQAVTKYGNQKCLGVRELISENQEFDENGKAVRKLQLGEYHWFTYNEIEDRVEAISKGFLEIGFQSSKPILIFAETRIEWFLSLHACFRINIPVSTLYATLGEDGIINGINESEVSTIITSQELISKLQNIIEKIPCVNQIIIMEDSKPLVLNKFPNKISIFKFSEIENIGSAAKNVIKPEPPKANDLALILYTSGSTGTPKGVVIKHKNIVTCILGGYGSHSEMKKFGNIYIAYLPLAHIFEVFNECFTFSMGIAIGYSSPYTLTDKSTAIMRGCKGDANLLRPYMIAVVPLMLDRIRKGINEMVSSKGAFSQKFFKFAVKYKYFWCDKGFNTPLLNRLVFHKIKHILGGRVSLMTCAGAPLSLDTHIFIKTCLDVKLIQCYGCTETTGGGTIMSIGDGSFGRVGPPLSTSHIKLIDWSEGGYKASDKPHPRGEIVIGGESVSVGYYKNEKLTQECFEENNGMRWFYTGDIGELYPDGTFKIIDRKKDLVKLQCGEYIALGKVEAEIKTSPLVDNICVVASGCHDYLTSIVTPNPQQLQTLASQLKKDNLSFPEMCLDNDICSAVTKQLKDHALKCRLCRREIPTLFYLCSEQWLPETGLVTAALKIRRKNVEHFYEKIINQMFVKTES